MKPLVAISLLLPLTLCSCDKVAEIAKKATAPAKTEAGTTPDPRPSAIPLVSRLKEQVDSSRPEIPLPLVTNLGSDEYDGFIAKRGALLVVDYHAEWCGPCKQLAPILERVASEFEGKVSIGKVNVDLNPALAEKAKVSSIPDVRFFRDGKQVARFVGIEDTERIRGIFKTHTADLKTVSVKGEDPQTPAPAANAPAASIERMGKDWLPPGMQRR